MNIDGVYDLFFNLHQDNLSFIYQGNFNDEITERIIDISETNIQNRQDQANLSNKVSFLLAECFQNVVRHGENSALKKLSEENSGVFITRNIGKSYYITSANVIENHEIAELKSKLEHINTLSREELKLLYINILSSGEFSHKGGAGLGLIEMSRRSGQKLDYDFETIDHEYSFFYLQIKLKGPEELVEVENDLETADLKVAKAFHHMMSKENIFIIHKGDFSQHTIIPILRMIDDNIKKHPEKHYSRKKIFHALVEILQNVSKHAYTANCVREAIFLMGRKDGHYHVYTGNYILNSNVDTLKDHIDNLNSLSREELTELYKLTLHLGSYTSKGGAGLGLIDISRDAFDKLHYSIIPVDDTVSFYVLGVRI